MRFHDLRCDKKKSKIWSFRRKFASFGSGVDEEMKKVNAQYSLKNERRTLSSFPIFSVDNETNFLQKYWLILFLLLWFFSKKARNQQFQNFLFDCQATFLSDNTQLERYLKKEDLNTPLLFLVKAEINVETCTAFWNEKSKVLNWELFSQCSAHYGRI